MYNRINTVVLFKTIFFLSPIPIAIAVRVFWIARKAIAVAIASTFIKIWFRFSTTIILKKK